VSLLRRLLACCCVPPCPQCAEDPTPRRLKVTLANIARCEGCMPSDYGWWKWLVAPAIDPNGEFTVAANGPCSWIYQVACTGSLGVYADGDCQTLVATVNLSWFIVSVAVKDNGAIEVWAWFDDDHFAQFNWPMPVRAFYHSFAHETGETCFPQSCAACNGCDAWACTANYGGYVPPFGVGNVFGFDGGDVTVEVP